MSHAPRPHIYFHILYGPAHRTCPRSPPEPCQRDCGGHHHRQWNLSGAGRDDAGCRIGKAGLSGLAGGRTALLLRSPDLRRAGRHEAAGRRRVRLYSRRLRTAGWISLCLDLVSDRQAGFDRHAGHGLRARPGKLPCLELFRAQASFPGLFRLLTDNWWRSPPLP